ncbi:MAG: hypothetical protein ACK58L_03725 [Planctomycetota bacterium]
MHWLFSDDHFLRGWIPWIRFSVIIIVFTAPGCSGTTSSDVATHAANERADHHDPGDHRDHHENGEDHHDDDHHHVPDHKPENFALLVTSLEARLKATAFLDRDRDEVMDIVRWLPEFAADSDLRRKDFESAVQVSRMLLLELEQLAGQKPFRGSQKISEGIGILKDLSTRSDLRPKVEPRASPSDQQPMAAEHPSE